MLAITAENLGCQFYNRWLFRGLHLQVEAGDALVLLGPNGSGKSTLLRMLAGQLAPTEGSIDYTLGNKPIELEWLYREVCWAGPNIALYDQLTLHEMLALHYRFKQPVLPIAQLLDRLQLTAHAHKPLRLFSSGMLQRARLGMVLNSAGSLLLLDEPTVNLDAANTALMLALLVEWRHGRTLVLASNQSHEYAGIAQQVVLGT